MHANAVITRWTVVPGQFLAQHLIWSLSAHMDIYCRVALHAWANHATSVTCQQNVNLGMWKHPAWDVLASAVRRTAP